MVQRPLWMREVLGSIPGFSKDMAETFLLFTATFMFCFLLFLIVFLPVLYPFFVYCYCHLRGWRLLSSCTKSLTALTRPWNRSWSLAVLQSLCYFLVLKERFLVNSFTLCIVSDSQRRPRERPRYLQETICNRITKAQFRALPTSWSVSSVGRAWCW